MTQHYIFVGDAWIKDMGRNFISYVLYLSIIINVSPSLSSGIYATTVWLN
ncbi:hypothetical protein [Flavobacterium urumqiense]|nr:hypothetical protein [Flavobacterium urumqiense]